MRPAQLVRQLTIKSSPAPPKKPRAEDTPSLPLGSLCYDHVFKRILGTKNQSEEILVDMLSAWRMSVTGDRSSIVEEVEIIGTGVKEGAGVHEKGALTVDVRARDAASNYTVEVQHRTEALYPHRALAYAAADIAGQPPGAPLRPVHVLAYCDFSFGAPKAGSKQLVGTTMRPSLWRLLDSKSEHQRDPTQALHAFGLQPLAFAPGAGLANQRGNPHLVLEMGARLSFLFALLPHAPLLHEITASTPPILKWAGLIAHLRAENTETLPREQGIFTPGVSRLVDVLKQTAETTRDEVKAEQEAASKLARIMESELDNAKEEGEAKGKAEGMAEGEAKGKAEGEAKGKAEGKAEGAMDVSSRASAPLQSLPVRPLLTHTDSNATTPLSPLPIVSQFLRSLGISSVAQYKDKFGAEPPADLATYFLRSK